MMKFNIISLFTAWYLLFSATMNAQVTFKLDSIYSYDWSESMSDWNNNGKDLYTYNNGGTKETNLRRLNLNGDVWENLYQYNKTYNGNNDILESILQNWVNGMWVNASRDTYTYNDSNNTTFSYAIYSMGNWLTFNESHYTYNLQNDITENLGTTYDYISQTMVNSTRETYFYNDKNLLDYEILEEWRTVISAWENEERLRYTYNANDQVILVETYGWSVSSMEWGSPYRQTILSYDNDLLTEVVEQTKASDVWVNSTRIVNTYDGNGNLIEILAQEWNSELEEWVNSNRQLRTFDANNNEIELIYESWDNLTSTWQGFLRQVKYWSPAETLSQAPVATAEVKFSIYPNPVTDQVNVKIDGGLNRPIKATLYDVFGNRIKSELLIYNEFQMSTKNQSAGVYFLKLNNSVYKIVKK